MRILVFLSIVIASVNSDIENFPPGLQVYRSSLISLKGSSLITLDRSFFDVYNNLRYNIRNVRSYYNQNVIAFNNSCNNFKYNITKPSTANRIASFCMNINTIVKYTLEELDDLISTFHHGMLGSDSETLKLAEYIWEAGEDNLNTLPIIYSRNQRCVSTASDSYVKIFKKYVDIIIGTSSATIKYIDSLFATMKNSTNDAAYLMKNMSIGLTSCISLNESTACAKAFLANYSDIKKDSAIEQLQQTIKNCTSNVNKVRRFYDSQMEAARQNVAMIDDDLDSWMENVVRCPINASTTVQNVKSGNIAGGSTKTPPLATTLKRSSG